MVVPSLPFDLPGETVAISFDGTDNVGNGANSTDIVLNIDVTGPTVSLDPAFSNGTVLQAKSALNLNGTVTDAQSDVQANAMRIQLLDSFDHAVSNRIAATVSGQSWQASQPFDAAPYGAYSLYIEAEDVLGNPFMGPVPSNLLLDGLAPYADMPMQSHLITQTGSVFSGIVSDVPYPVGGNRLVHLHFEEAAGATSFINGSIYAGNGIGTDGSVARLTATCSGKTCPKSDASGRAGNALAFDGVDDYLTMPHVLNPAETSFTAAAWFKAMTLPTNENKRILQQKDGTGVGRSWLYLTSSGQLATYLGGSQLASQQTVNAGEWHHAAVSYDGNLLTLYLNGEQATAPVARNMESSDGQMLIGAHKALDRLFDGSIDEVVIYGEALSASEIYNIANPLSGSVAQTQIRFRHAGGAVWSGVDPDNVALYLPMDEQVGSTSFEDFSVNQHYVTCSNEKLRCPVAGEVGKHGNAPTFDGKNDYLTVPHVLDPAETSFSVSVWFKIDNLLQASGTMRHSPMMVRPSHSI